MNDSKKGSLDDSTNVEKSKSKEAQDSANAEPINDKQILNTLINLVKQRRDSIESFKASARNDLIDKEKKEIEIINQFLPKQLSADEIRIIIKKFFSDNNISSIKEMGKIMGYLKSNHAGNIDMSLAGKIAKDLLEK